MNLQFEYDIDETPEGLEVDKLKSEDRKEFETVLGDILVDIVESKNENRTDNTDKPAL